MCALTRRAALQFAFDAPSDTLVASAAAALSCKPPARLMTKESDWPSMVATFQGHKQAVHSVVFSGDGKYVVSASEDSSVRQVQGLQSQEG